MIHAENILICIMFPMAVAMFFVRGNARRFTFAMVSGMLVCLVSAYLSGYMNYLGATDTEETAIFISPIIEEIMKFVPLIFYMLLFEPADDQLYVFATGIGAGFATFENCCYILTNGAESLPFVMVRGMAVGVMHIVSMIAVATGLVLIRRFKALSVAGIVGALSMSVMFHALYNLLVSKPGASSLIGYCLPTAVAASILIIRNLLRRETLQTNAEN
ncbi:MAG: PrsW family intramembrane metalloprotease [Lachnospiraceae bacterium]|nr:PrsW family intramembrane metalloprotease [Lachnospiraceae bacterium]MBP5185188.1 PrsW family intramembrane metalloprotease [Lachnospiraceae bacterium]